MVQWLGLLTFTPKFQSLVVELRSHKLHGAAKNKNHILWSIKILFSLPFHLSGVWLSVSSPLACTSQPHPNWVPCFVPNTSVPLPPSTTRAPGRCRHEIDVVTAGPRGHMCVILSPLQEGEFGDISAGPSHKLSVTL